MSAAIGFVLTGCFVIILTLNALSEEKAIYAWAGKYENEAESRYCLEYHLWAEERHAWFDLVRKYENKKQSP